MSLPRLKQINSWSVYPLNNTYPGKLRISHDFILEDNMIICPKCHELVAFNSYFGAYICKECNWKDDSFRKKRIETEDEKLVKELKDAKDRF